MGRGGFGVETTDAIRRTTDRETGILRAQRAFGVRTPSGSVFAEDMRTGKKAAAKAAARQRRFPQDHADKVPDKA